MESNIIFLKVIFEQFICSISAGAIGALIQQTGHIGNIRGSG